MTAKEKLDILLKYFGTEYGDINLSDIDFGNRIVFNNNQAAKIIYNSYQKAKIIYNNDQEANEICNEYQIIKPNYEDMSKEELIARIRELENE